MSKLETNTIDTLSGTTNLVIGSTNSSTVTFENGSPTGHMYPAFHAYLGSNQTSISGNTNTKVQINTEVLDTDSAFDTSTYRFTPQKSGKYYVYANLTGEFDTYKLHIIQAQLYKNGSSYAETDSKIQDDSIQKLFSYISTVVDMNGSSDYLEFFGMIDRFSGGSSTGTFYGGSSQRSYFGAYRLGA